MMRGALKLLNTAKGVHLLGLSSGGSCVFQLVFYSAVTEAIKFEYVNDSKCG